MLCMARRVNYMDVIHNQNDPPKEYNYKIKYNSFIQSTNNARAPAGQTVLGQHFLAYFFVAVDKEVCRQLAKPKAYEQL